MEFALSEEERLLQSSVTGYLAEHCPLDRVRRAAEGRITREPSVWAGLAELGAFGVVVPEAYGGADMGYLAAALVSEALGATAAPVPFVGTAVMLPAALLHAGSDAQRETWLPRLAAGACVAGVAVTEQIGRRDSEGVVVAGDTVSGKALFVLDGMDADVLLVAGDGGRMALVDATVVERRLLKTIDRTRSLAEVRFDRSPGELLPGSLDGAAALRRVIDVGRIMLAADTLGAAQTLLDKAVAYAGERRQFNRVIGSFQAVKHLCAEMAAELEPCRSLVWYAAHSVRAMPQETRVMACHAKAHLSEVGRFVARASTEVHGGMGMTDLLGNHYWFKRVGANRQLLGAPELVRREAAVAQALA